jgi:hypothetical protein
MMHLLRCLFMLPLLLAFLILYPVLLIYVGCNALNAKRNREIKWERS